MKEIEKLESEIVQKREELNELVYKIDKLKDIEFAKKCEKYKDYIVKYLIIDDYLYIYIYICE